MLRECCLLCSRSTYWPPHLGVALEYLYFYCSNPVNPCRAPRSLCPTFAAVALFINNARWDGVPFLLKAGKALASRRTEIRVQFHHVPGSLYRDRMGDADRATNELVRASLGSLNRAGPPRPRQPLPRPHGRHRPRHQRAGARLLGGPGAKPKPLKSATRDPRPVPPRPGQPLPRPHGRRRPRHQRAGARLLGSGGIIKNPEICAPRTACGSTTSRAASTATAWATPTAPPTSWCGPALGSLNPKPKTSHGGLPRTHGRRRPRDQRAGALLPGSVNP